GSLAELQRAIKTRSESFLDLKPACLTRTQPGSGDGAPTDATTSTDTTTALPIAELTAAARDCPHGRSYSGSKLSGRHHYYTIRGRRQRSRNRFLSAPN